MKIKFLYLFFIFFFLFTFQFGQVYADVSGQERDFLLYGSFAEEGKDRSEATLRLISKKAYFYVDNKYFNSLDKEKERNFFISLQKLADEYDKRIYPILTNKFAKMAEPGIDGEDRVYILLLPLAEDVGGYTNTADGFFKKNVADGLTNEKDLVYINVNFLNSKKINGFLAHEIQHLISLQNKEEKKGIFDDVWLNELRSEYALEFLGYNESFSGSVLERRLSVFKKNPTDSLTEWRNKSEDYAVVNLFSHYLAEAYGEDIFKKMLISDDVGIKSINDALKKMGYLDNFKDVFRNWQIANYLNDTKVFGDRFGYKNKNLNFKIPPTLAQMISEGEKEKAVFFQKDWQMAWLEYYGAAKFLTFKIESKDNISLAYIFYNSDKSFSFGDVKLNNNKGSFSIKDFGSKVKSVILLPFFTEKTSNFSDNEADRSFSLEISTDKNDFSESGYEKLDFYLPEASLIRPAWSYDVYLVKGNFIRYISMPEFLNFYKEKKINILEREDFNRYKKSNLIRAIGDYRVYQINEDGSKQWLDVGAEEFIKSGKSFLGVFEVTEKQMQMYKDGPKITKL